MKKVISLMLVMAMVFGVNVTSYAKEPEARKEAVVTEAELDTSVLKENVDVETASVARIANLAEFDGYVSSGDTPVSFYVPSSKTTVYITIASTAACKVQMLTPSGNIVSSSTVSVPGDAKAHTYSLRKNCSTGTYFLKFYSDSATSFYTALTISYTQQ